MFMDSSTIVKDIPALAPWDTHNQLLAANVHPLDWANPTPKPRYDLVVIGAGTAGLVSAAGAAGLGANVALIEKDLMGGDCLNVGCVPSKALIRAARACAGARDGSEFGIARDTPVHLDFPAIMERMRKLRSNISGHDSAARFRSLGIDVFLGSASFSGPDSVVVDGRQLNFRKAVIATGARADELPLPGIREAGYLTNENVFSLTTLPQRLAVIGAGPMGCELAQAFARFGSMVTLLKQEKELLPREDRDAAAEVERALLRDGVQLNCCKIKGISREGTEKIIALECPDQSGSLRVDEILIGVGRAPNVDGLNLEAAGIQYDRRSGVKVDDQLRTTNRRIFAAGDICFPYKFTHTADVMARIVIQNALFWGRKKTSSLIIPWCTYTDPEVAHVGLYPEEAAKRGIAINTINIPMVEVDRALLDSQSRGFLKVHLAPKTGRILGATLVASHAGDMISELTLAMTAGISLDRIATVIHPYPTQAAIIKQAADAYNRQRLTPRVKKLLGAILKIGRR
ncbi:MAG: mercuric reductase [Phycisphaerae bacterium]|nr:mercuric reductase [Phycisphaerae bacterium]